MTGIKIGLKPLFEFLSKIYILLKVRYMEHFWVKIFKNEEFHKICSVKFSKILYNKHGSENDFIYFVRTTVIISEENFFGFLGIK